MDNRPATFIKICGITRLADAQADVRAGANAVGFVFAPSPRAIAPGMAKEIAAHVHPSVATMGVFVDASVDQVLDTVAEVGLAGVQLQGAEDRSFVAELRAARPGLFVAKAVRVTGRELLGDVEEVGADALMVDSKDPAHPEQRHGVLSPGWLAGVPWPARLILAGGLTPGNVGGMVQAVRPWGVDVSGGVEESPGKKDHQLVRAFVHAVRQAEGLRVAEGS